MRAWFVIAGLVMLTTLQGASAVDFSTVEFAGKTFTVCRVNVRKEHLELYHRDDTGQPFKRFDRLTAWLLPQGKKLVFAMNAGMYHADFSAVGLFVAGGQQLVPLNTASGEGNFFLKPNGVFVLTASGARVIEASEYPNLHERVVLATQSGPLLVHNGRLHPAFREGSESRLVRNGVGVPLPDAAIFVMSDVPVNFYEFATFFRDRLHCPDALFLDGTISSVYSTELKRNDFRMDLGPIIGVTE
ncbi:MAG: phosphodiester glycosidase family protein [Chthoniobacter sp.]|uniref:phosphodiester glycosidase family protein n=1 Tax=Chthoniobacter sp. TaxID=2510640 RepID=UPI0032AA26BD